jgi:hypothetical protein
MLFRMEMSASEAKRKSPKFNEKGREGCRKLVVDEKEYFMEGDLWDVEREKLPAGIFGSVLGQMWRQLGGGWVVQRDGNRLFIGPLIPAVHEEY